MYVKLKVLLLRKIYVVMDTAPNVMSIELHVCVPNAHINREEGYPRCDAVTLLCAISMFICNEIFPLSACLHHSLITRSSLTKRRRTFLREVVNNIGKSFF